MYVPSSLVLYQRAGLFLLALTTLQVSLELIGLSSLGHSSIKHIAEEDADGMDQLGNPLPGGHYDLLSIFLTKVHILPQTSEDQKNERRADS